MERSKVHYLDFSENKINKNNTVENIVRKLKPSLPVYFLRPNAIKKAAKFFLDNFSTPKYNNKIVYSVKSNPDEASLNYLFEAGIKHYDVASMQEVKLIDKLFGQNAKMYFMHPIKSREAIHQAYFNFGIRDFSLDSSDELKKILEITNNAKDLNLHLRLSIPNSHAKIDLSSKFGILPSKSSNLIRKTRAVSKRFGICFHVGSQCMDPIEYRNAIMITKEVLDKAQVKIDVLDIGGGFPSNYPGMTPPDLQSYFNEIFDTIKQIDLNSNCEVWCEPGRALTAESSSLLVRVESKKDNMLYINDGTYGGLFDAGFIGFIYPTKAIRVKKSKLSDEMGSFGFYGPTCDSLDTMKGPFTLPKNICEGDYIEIGQMGAYSKSLRTNFNGFEENLQFEVSDEPISSIFTNQINQNEQERSFK